MVPPPPLDEWEPKHYVSSRLINHKTEETRLKKKYQGTKNKRSKKKLMENTLNSYLIRNNSY